jgi:hypothetical protein
VDFDFRRPATLIAEVGGRLGYMKKPAPTSARRQDERRRNHLQLMGKVAYFLHDRTMSWMPRLRRRSNHRRPALREGVA